MPDRDDKRDKSGDDKDSRRTHSVSDHQYGVDAAHTHDGEEWADHDHDDPGPGGPLEENPIWIQDHVSLVSVGIDIGSSGTQVIFSRVNLRRPGEDLSSRYVVVSRETLFQSPVALTPYQSEERIDDAALGGIIDEAYAQARMHPDEIDAGVVILTGEALRRQNAQAIADVLAQHGGEFVCASAGHHMEAMLAAYGSGAARVSHDEGKRVLNIDIGGGTTKLAVVAGGRVLETAAVHIGGRLQVVDAAGRVVRLDPAGRYLASKAGHDWGLGDPCSAKEMERVAEWMAEALVTVLRVRPLPHAIEHLYLTEPLRDLDGIDGVMFSGGVAEYVYERESRDFGDMGRLFGRALRRRIDAGALPWPLLPPGECIRATAIGASEYSVQLSGNTIYISSPGELLPRKNLQVLQPSFACEDDVDPERLSLAIRSHFTTFDLVEGESEVALAFRWRGAPSYERIAGFAQGVVRGLPRTIAEGKPLYLVLDGDIAQTLGAILREEMRIGSEVLVLDGIVLWDLDYVDLGRMRWPSNTVPVTVKSLLFSDDPRHPADPNLNAGRHARDHDHHHDQDHHDDHDHGHHHGHDHGHDHGHAHRGERSKGKK